MQPAYNQNAKWRVESQELKIHKVTDIKDSKDLMKMVNILSMCWLVLLQV
jgi:hypothetical protein